MNKVIPAFVACTLLVAFADAADASRFSFFAGPAFRTRAKTSFSMSGASSGAAAAGFVSADGTQWSGTFSELPETTGGIIGGNKDATHDWALEVTRASGGNGSASDEDGAMGLDCGASYVFFERGPFSFDLRARFAGYWDIRNGGAIGSDAYLDTYRFLSANGVTLGGATPSLDAGDVVDPNLAHGTSSRLPGMTSARCRYEADLYEIGIGPRMTWHACPHADVSFGVEALFAFVDSTYTAGTLSRDETDFLGGVGADLTMTGYVTENVGLFAKVGYEWLNESTLTVGGYRAETDFSSLVLSAGLQVAF